MVKKDDDSKPRRRGPNSRSMQVILIVICVSIFAFSRLPMARIAFAQHRVRWRSEPSRIEKDMIQVVHDHKVLEKRVQEGESSLGFRLAEIRKELDIVKSELERIEDAIEIEQEASLNTVRTNVERIEAVRTEILEAVGNGDANEKNRFVRAEKLLFSQLKEANDVVRDLRERSKTLPHNTDQQNLTTEKLPAQRARVVEYGEHTLKWPPVPVTGEIPSGSNKIFSFDGAPRTDAYLAGGNALSEFTIQLGFRADESGGCVPAGPFRAVRSFVDYEEASPAPSAWYAGGCALVNSIYASQPPPVWSNDARKRRHCCAVPPENELYNPGGMQKEAVEARKAVKRLLTHGARSDFGLALSPNGKSILFGIGHRDFLYRAKNARPVRDLTLEATMPTGNLIDGQWHTLQAVRRRRRSSDDFVVDDFQDDVLEVYIDGILVSGGNVNLRATGGSDGRAAAAAACVTATRLAKNDSTITDCEPNAIPPHELHDAKHRVELGQLFRGCLGQPVLLRRALTSDQEAQAWHSQAIRNLKNLDNGKAVCDGTLAALLQGSEKSVHTGPPVPLYYLAHSDNGSVAMRQAFESAIADPPSAIEPRLIEIHKNQTRQKDRYGPKGSFILQALENNPKDSFVLISDIDIRIFQPLAEYIQYYVLNRGNDVDIVFQRDDDFSINANLGFMALRCTPEVHRYFATIAKMATDYASGSRYKYPVNGGDQKIVNVYLKDPDRLPSLPRLKWALFPSELMTRSIDQQRGALYRDESMNVFYHVNDFGSNDINPDKARSTKVSLLDLSERQFRNKRAFFQNQRGDARKAARAI